MVSVFLVAMEERLMSRKKPTYPINETLARYLKECNRTIKISVFYEDLLRFSGCVVVYDKDDQDTLWVRTYYEDHERREIDDSLKQVYSVLHSDGNEAATEFLNIDAIDYCTFGNSKPFRIKIRNILNDNFTYIYVKKGDASRIYGLELEHLFSPNRINFLVYKNTLIEEHIAGIPGDTFIKDILPGLTNQEKAQIAKEFVKFNERCQMLLLGDMRSYNYVIVTTHDFDHVLYKIRPIDFDQQCYEGKLKVYQPQFFKENFPMVQLVSDRLQSSSIELYKKEERSVLAKRMIAGRSRAQSLLAAICTDKISTADNLKLLREQLYDFTLDLKFRRCKTMGEVLRTALEFVRRNYENVNVNRF